MVANGLKDMGFEYLNLDDGWAVNRTAAGVLVADPKLFPPSSPGANDGIKIVADYVHERGLKFGIYTARGSTTCLGRPSSDSHEQLDGAHASVQDGRLSGRLSATRLAPSAASAPRLTCCSETDLRPAFRHLCLQPTLGRVGES